MISLPNPPILKTMTTAAHSDLATRQERLVGDELLAFIRGNESMTKEEQCLGAGYIKTLEDGSTGGNYLEFYLALLDADDKEYDDWHESLEEQDKDLINEIQESCGDFNDYTPEQCQEFIDKLNDLGIFTASQFEDAFCHQASTCHDGSHLGDFVEAFHDEMGTELPEYLVIDWQASWYQNYRHDFSAIDHYDETYFFFSHFH